MNSRHLILCTGLTTAIGGTRGTLLARHRSRQLQFLISPACISVRGHASRPEEEHAFTFHAESRQYKKCCAVLQVPDNADQEQVRQAYLELAKKYHPDGGTSEASKDKFHEIDEAYKYLQKAFADFRHNRHKVEGEYGLYYNEKRRQQAPSPTEFDEEDDDKHIKHVTPQHRQYLNYDGVGIGTPFQREKGYQKYRAAKAAENLYDHRIEKLTQSEGTEETALTKNRREAKKGSTRYGFERLVEDLIQESMAKGDFKDLKGAGKPLHHTAHSNPHVDFTTHKMNQVLIENGFTPEWIMLEKEIRTEIRDIRHALKLERHKYDKEMTDPAQQGKWATFLGQSSLKLRIEDLNTKIGKYNLVVPILFKQIVPMDLRRELRKADQEWSQDLRDTVLITESELSKYSQSVAGAGQQRLSQNQGSTTTSTTPTLVSLIFSMFSNTK